MSVSEDESGAEGGGSVGRRRRRWSEAQKRQIVAKTHEPGVSVPMVAQRYNLNANQVIRWRRLFRAPERAGLDRLLHHAIVIQIEGASYRLRAHTDPRRNAVPKKRRGRPPKQKRRFRSIIPADHRSTKSGDYLPFVKQKIGGFVPTIEDFLCRSDVPSH